MSKGKAITWKICEAIKALRDGDVEARIDIATRFPLFATATDDEILDEITLMTARQVEIRMKKKLLGGEAEEIEEDESEELKEITEKVEKEAEQEIAEEVEDEKPGAPEDSEPEEVEAEVIEEKKKEDITEDDLDDLFSDMKD